MSFFYTRLKFVLFKVYEFFKYKAIQDITYVSRVFKRNHGYRLNLSQPRTLNEKITWIKLHVSHPLESVFADKLLVRNYISEKFSNDFLVPCVFQTAQVADLKPQNLPDFPVIIKANHDSGSYKIIRNKDQHNWNDIRDFFRQSISRNYFWPSRERQYKYIQPMIIVEKLLLDSKGRIPNDYKLHCLNGKVEFIYCSIDREGEDYRLIYSKNWERLNFQWLPKDKISKGVSSGYGIDPPSQLRRMLDIAEEIASEFVYVRIDFYEVDGELFSVR